MTGFTFIVLICGIMLLLLLVRAIMTVRQESGQTRGTPPGKGRTEIDASYFSGGSGGGQAKTYSITQDPQEYAKAFVPKEGNKK